MTCGPSMYTRLNILNTQNTHNLDQQPLTVPKYAQFVHGTMKE